MNDTGGNTGACREAVKRGIFRWQASGCLAPVGLLFSAVAARAQIESVAVIPTVEKKTLALADTAASGLARLSRGQTFASFTRPDHAFALRAGETELSFRS